MSNNLNRSRIVVNKYTDTPSDIISGVCSDGEIVISTKKGNEGLYIKNNEGEIVKIIDNTHCDISRADYEKLVNYGGIDENVYYMIYDNDN